MSQPNKNMVAILVVDDNKENLKVVSNFLKSEGYQIALALNAEDATKILRDTPIDLILLDVMMPGTDGFTMCRTLKKDKDLRDIPVIFLTAKTETSDLVEGFQAGGVDYITKPFQKEELIARINNHIALTSAQKEIVKQAEQIKKINRTKDRLYSVIAHDIKSPFANISMLISTISDGYLEPGSEEFNEIIQNINSSTQETYSLLENLLQWTKSQTGDLEQKTEQLNLEDLVGNSCRFLEPTASRKQISLSYNLDPNLEIMADRNMMQSVLQNLINNSIKFTNEGGKVSISAQTDNKEVVIQVKDNGIGISEDNQKRLFIDDGQLTTRGTGNEKGSGLGLLLVKEFVQKNNGTIQVKSEEGKGTIFTIRLPVV